jgi:hypothetical protein
MGEIMRAKHDYAEAALRYAISREPDELLLGCITAAELVALTADAVMQCPKCGAESWVNIDCDLCLVVSQIQRGEMP